MQGSDGSTPLLDYAFDLAVEKLSWAVNKAVDVAVNVGNGAMNVVHKVTDAAQSVAYNTQFMLDGEGRGSGEKIAAGLGYERNVASEHTPGSSIVASLPPAYAAEVEAIRSNAAQSFEVVAASEGVNQNPKVIAAVAPIQEQGQGIMHT